jgi:transglutaminase/protease-like cytokinesis protein 3
MKRDVDKAAELRKKYPDFYRQFGMADYRRQAARRLHLSKFLKSLYVPTLLCLFVLVFTYMVYDGKRPLNPDYVPTPELSQSVKRNIDQTVSDASRLEFTSYEELTDFLVEPYTDEHERFYSIYRWVTSNISYDVDSLREGRVTNEDNLPDTVFKRKLAVCDGYSKLLSSMTSHAGLDIEYVSGRADGLSGRLSTILAGNEGHAWNIVRLNGYWYPVDSTWDAGYVDDQVTRFIRKTDKFDYYLSDPNSFHVRHKAKEPNKNLLNDVEMNQIDLIWSYLLNGQSFSDFILSKLHTLVSEI